MISALQIVTLTAQCLLYLSLEAVSKATILHILIHQAGGGTIIAIGNQGQDIPMMIPKGEYQFSTCMYIITSNQGPTTEKWT